MDRSELRHVLYRAKNGMFSESKEHIYNMVEPLIPLNESWKTFANNWDVFYKDGVVTVIKPETDYEFIHATCLERSFCAKNAIEMDASSRQLNALQIVELNMLENKMKWETYNITWGVGVDHVLKRINTRLFATSINKVTPEMIANSAKSDGAAMSEMPTISSISLSQPTPMTDAEIEQFDAVTNIKTHKRKKAT